MSDIDYIKRAAALSSAEQVALFERINKQKKLHRGNVTGAIPRQDRVSREFPLSFAQQRLWFLEQFDPDTTLYSIPEALTLRGYLDKGALLRAFAALIARHETLRTIFSDTDGEPRQCIALYQAADLPVIDLRGIDSSQRTTVASVLVHQEEVRPFNLVTGPLLRTTLLQLSEQEHILLLSMHHIISDGWSKGILMNDLLILYHNFTTTTPFSQTMLPELPIQYADFAVWQRTWLQGAILEEQLAYWRAKLTNVPSLQLPTDYPRPAIQTVHGATSARHVPLDLTEKLVALGRQEKCTLFMVVLAAFDILLARYSGQEDIAVGTAIANRNRADIENLIGFFVNTLVLRVDLTGNPTFREFLGRVREVCLGAYAHQDLPFEQLVEELQPTRDLSGNPLVQVNLTLQNTPTYRANDTSLLIAPIDVDIRTAKFDITVYVIQNANGLVLDAEYRSDLFKEATILRMLTHLAVILEAIVATPDHSIATMPLLTAAERTQILYGWNDTQAVFPSQHTLHSLIAEQAARTPNAIAVQDAQGTLTYRELNQRANQLARYLVTRGVGVDQPVGVCVNRSAEMIIILLGILKAGGAYVPLDPSYPTERLAFMASDAGLTTLILQEETAQTVPFFVGQCVVLDHDWTTIAHYDQSDVVLSVLPNHLAYIIYTSGSTGVPKGVQIPHMAVVNFLTTMSQQLAITKDDIGMALTSISFDIAGLEMYLPLLVGARVVVVSREIATNANELASTIDRANITILQATPATWRSLLDTGWQGKPHLKMLCGGEALSRNLADALLASGGTLWNMYGPTETTIWSLIQLVERDEGPIMIGRPIANTHVYIVDTYLQPVPIGVAGEIYIGGTGLARGYRQRTDLTAERFIPDPFTSVPDARIYRTGDAARYDANGTIEYLGRLDTQVKVRGFRIELGEVEAILQQHPAVREAVAIVRADTDAENATEQKRLLAYVTRRKYHNQDDDQQQAQEWFTEQVTHWQQVWDTIYEDLEVNDMHVSLAGWNSSYTSQPIPESEMREWETQIVARILLQKPKRVLEIGCGTGLLLFPIAPSCDAYWGVDFSAKVVENLRTQIRLQKLSQVTLLQREGDDFSGILAAQRGTFDVVIINSVIQYFPSVDYLLQVLAGAVQMAAPGGCVFVGDVRSLPLLEAFHTSVQLRQASLSLLTDQLRLRIQKRIAQENELVVDPAFFMALQRHIPQISAVEIQLKGGRSHNELTRFRYDVKLHIDRPVQPITDFPQLDWKEAHLTVSHIHDYLHVHQPAFLVVNNIPNARVLSDTAVTALLANDAMTGSVGDLWQQLHERPSEVGIDPEDLWQLSTATPYTIRIHWSETIDTFAVQFTRYDDDPQRSLSLLVSAQTPTQVKPWSNYTTNPMQAESTSTLVPELRDYLRNRLPEYMIPSVIMLLDALPLTNNGKIDRQALPSPDGSRPVLKNAFMAPRTPAEQLLAAIWADVLGIKIVGIHDNFFELGGDSLMSIRVVAKAGKSGLGITTKQLFQHQTIATLAASTGTTHTLTEQGVITGPMPLMPVNSYTFGNRLGDPRSHSLVFLLEGNDILDAKFIEPVAYKVIAHHDALRMHALEHEGEWHLTIPDLDAVPSTWQIDLTQLTEVEQIATIREVIRDIAIEFDLTREPLLRLALFELGVGKPTPLMVAGHSLVVDMQSWQFLMDDIQNVYIQLSQAQRAHLPPKTTSYIQWAARLREYSHSSQLLAELPYWMAEQRQRVPRLPKDFPTGENTGASLFMALDMLNLDETSTLLHKVAKNEGLQVDVILLTAVAQTLMEWTNERLLLVTVEGHGRTPDFDDIDLSRTLGTLAMDYPLLLDMEHITTLGDALTLVKAALKQSGKHGIDYNALTVLNTDPVVAAQLNTLPKPDVFFNYLAASVAPAVTHYRVSGPYNGRLFTSDETTLHPLPLLVTGYLADGQLQVSWHFSTNQFRKATIDALAHRTIAYVREILAAL